MSSRERSVSRDFSDAQLKLIRRTVARACTPGVDEFIAVAALCGLDPLRRQISPLIVAADHPDRRRLIPWTTIDGLRVIAARHGDYRPMEEAPVIEYDDARIDEATNPLGIVRAEVRAWRASRDAWHAVVGEAWWEEYAPLHGSPGANRHSADHPETSGQEHPVTTLTLDPSWRRMGRVMIAKCAEAQALRRGWPDVLSGLYGDEELQALRLSEHTASELLHAARLEEVQKRKAKRMLWFVAEPGGAFQSVTAGEVEAFVAAVYAGATDPGSIRRFDEDNQSSLATFWRWMPIEALRLKQKSQTLQVELAKQNGVRTPPGDSSSPSCQRRSVDASHNGERA
ncbi:MAG: phage recombination protein Bet [Hyphomonadaceae bacterium]